MRSAVLAASAGLLLSTTQGHVILESPKPYKFAAYGPSNPLSPDGSDYPCKIPPGTTKLEIDGVPTKMVVGETQTMSFTGLAVHGGGSCQISLTPGFEPNKQSKFSVIHSIEGGCPAANQKGNLAEGQSPDTYEYVIPNGIDEGQYTLSWSWWNRIGGQIEMYQNCAPITVTASNKSRSRHIKERRRFELAKREERPDMFMANLGDVSDGCNTSEALTAQVAISFPHPGSSVAHPEGTENLFQQKCDGNLANSHLASGTSCTGFAGVGLNVSNPA
ncbi:hypothetical protein BJ170DRAFT_593437 [Xylariales sp. AK1849]|nr:hypothetical protein BJ170DRAFT_593437 [Xylariales sp. AK1849]